MLILHPNAFKLSEVLRLKCLPKSNYTWCLCWFLSQKYALVDTGYFVGLSPTENSQINLGKSRDEFKLEIKQGTWWTLITLHKEDASHSSWIEELKSAALMNSISSTKNQQENKERLTREEHATCCIRISWIRWYKEKLNARRGLDQRT